MSILFISINSASAQNNSRLRISLLTCTPGTELYSIFGHSAIRVIDSNSVTDLVFNYGTFDFDEDFYFKFVKGRLQYYISISPTSLFIEEYQFMRRGITEQELLLSRQEKKQIYDALKENCKEANKYYAYDFFLDNCTTRLRDLLQKSIRGPFVQHYTMPQSTTFREAIHAYLHKGGQLWSELGIDLLLGAGTDRVMTASEQAFLPDNLMMSVDQNQTNKWVGKRTELYTSPYEPEKTGLMTPLFVFGLLALLAFLLSISKQPVSKTILSIFDFLLYFSFGAVGWILFLAWFFTDHSMTKLNLNLIWAFPTHLIFAFFLFGKFRFKKYYWIANGILSTLLIGLWFFLPQSLNIALLPIVMTMAFRSFIRYRQS
jgi:hypothetical protein